MACLSYIRCTSGGDTNEKLDLTRIPPEELLQKMAQRDACVLAFSRVQCGRIEGLNKNTVCAWRDPDAMPQELILDDV